jgi:hypothetical protein
MTALVIENLAALPVQAQSVRDFLTRLARIFDALIRARAARAVPEWRMRQVQREIDRYQGLIRAAEKRHSTERNKKVQASIDLVWSESAICNFGR